MTLLSNVKKWEIFSQSCGLSEHLNFTKKFTRYFLNWYNKKFESTYVHSGQKCFVWVACLWSKMPMLQRAGLREGGEPLPLTFQYLILMVWRSCDLNLVIISSVVSRCQDFKFGKAVFQPFYEMKLNTSKFKVLAFWSQWRYYDQIQITRSSYYKNQIFKC